MKLACLVVFAAIWSVCAYAKGPEAPKQMIRNMCEPTVSIRKTVQMITNSVYRRNVHRNTLQPKNRHVCHWQCVELFKWHFKV